MNIYRNVLNRRDTKVILPCPFITNAKWGHDECLVNFFSFVNDDLKRNLITNKFGRLENRTFLFLCRNVFR